MLVDVALSLRAFASVCIDPFEAACPGVTIDKSLDSDRETMCWEREERGRKDDNLEPH